jgi:RNA polymerase sigma-70 factor (ECF subfamily)
MDVADPMLGLSGASGIEAQVERPAAWDDSAFEQMVTAHHGEIYRYLRRVTGRASDADDLSQETFLRAYRAYRSLPEDANTRAWLFTIATNVSRNHFRARKRRQRVYDAVRATARDVDGTGPEGEALGRQVSAVIEAAVARLPLKQRLAFLQRKIHGLDYDAIGESLQCSPEAARAHVFQALKKIRHALNGHELGPKEREP